MRIDDLVTNIDEDTLLRIEADCRTGVKPVDSAECVDALARVQRNAPDAVLNPNAITNVLINPINAALERVSGLDTALSVKWNLFDKHRFTWATSYTRVLSHRKRQFESDAERDYLHALDNMDWPDKLISNLTWSVGRWTSNLQVERYGRVPNAAQTAFITPTSYAAKRDHASIASHGPRAASASTRATSCVHQPPRRIERASDEQPSRPGSGSAT